MTTSLNSQPDASPTRRGTLALSLQEALTATVRLRSDRQVATDATTFRSQVKQLLAAADRQARSAGYDPSYVKMAVYAFVAFLDESVLNSSNPMFAEWHRRPLQEEVFGDLLAGENFFRNVQQLLAQQDSEDLADTLEVYQLCMLLGFKGKHGAGDGGQLVALMSTVQDKIMRIRGGAEPVSTVWGLPEGEEVILGLDPWIKPMRIGAAIALTLTLLLWTACSVSLNRKVDRLQEASESLQTASVFAPPTPGAANGGGVFRHA